MGGVEGIAVMVDDVAMPKEKSYIIYLRMGYVT